MDQRQLFLRDILTVVFKRFLLIVSFAAAVFLVVYVGNYAWPVTYESTASVRLTQGREVSTTDPTVMKSGAGLVTMQLTREDLNSEIEFIRSTDVLKEVVQKLELDKDVPLNGGALRAALRSAKKLVDNAQYALALARRPDPVEAGVELLRDAIIVKPVKDSHILEIRCQMGTAKLAHDVLEATLEAYKKKHLEVFSTPEGDKFFTEQMTLVEEKLRKAQEALKSFRDEHKIASVDIEKNLLLQQYTDAKKLLAQLTESAAATETLGQAEPDATLVATLSRATDNTVVTELQLRLLELILDRNRLVQSLGPKHPQVQAIASEIASAQARLKEAIASSKEVTAGKIAELEERLKNFHSIENQISDLERDVRIQSAAYEYYAQKREEARVSEAMGDAQISNIRITSQPDTPTNPIRPRKLFNLALALIAGLVGGTALAFFLEYLDHGLKTPEDVEHFLKIPPLASFFRSAKERLEPREAQRLTTMLDMVQSGTAHPFTLIASSVAAEGSQRVARSLAEAKAENPNAKVLLVDFVGASDGAGFVDILLGSSTMEELVALDGNLYTLGRGSHEECPTYLWTSKQMDALAKELRDRFDHVVFHVPPVLLSNDALNLARAVDGLVIVVRADSTRREVVQRAMDMIAGAKGRVIGAVLTERKQVIPSAVYRRI
ncbi:MAG: polysaccharide biosynthesis tyrosine autokinase [Candidatus Hydrogenedentes bacterium]|nr:polysaccharide biosynthesis tyrosine autokinase [Candidatus Hydrogenedentota bacterium]